MDQIAMNIQTSSAAVRFSSLDRTTNYFTEIGNSFGATSFSSTASLTVIAVLCGVIVVLLGVIVVLSYLKRKHGSYVPAGWILRPAEIAQQLQKAIDQRGKVELQFHRPG